MVRRAGPPPRGALHGRRDALPAPAGAARYDGFFPIRLESADQLAEIVARLGALREEAGRNPDEPYEVIAELETGVDPMPYREAGATWWLVALDWEGISLDRVRRVIREGPA